MGLDMYLKAKRTFEAGKAPSLVAAATYTPENDEDDEGLYLAMWQHCKAGERDAAKTIVGAVGLSDFVTDEAPSGSLKRLPSGEIVAGVNCAYWRKANAIHRWFVEKVQGGLDECQTSPVTREQLGELANTCRAALGEWEGGRKRGAAKLMPPQSGFFFGSTDVDEYWATDLRDTIKQVERVLELAKDRPEITFAYRASW